ncbi:AAA family ATPase [Tautonia plasticadhaerens]|uniref:ATPase family associated with various cellular activities (AAA) n=1 Tax=Tautonia plasticadhaerens TaxID=2527974 RepID=A0A518H2Y3_9BACT|nr:MoxR family ATPase [Tautonia plasticadhaerens]QDV35194.1 ATPase family associated with various cellular activities (AAA) [Tautonia plasticadhaerens]
MQQQDDEEPRRHPRGGPDGRGTEATALPDLGPLVARLEAAVVGQRPLLERMVIALLAGGHVLIEGVPGLAKTRAVRALARALDLPFRRIQFTPDLLPADLTGTQVYHPQTGRFDVKHGPIVAGVLLADEINRAPAKVQSALLEAMQEGQVTIGDETIRLPDPFFVLATQNPIEQEGTYPLPEAQLDRFLMKLLVGYPGREAELAMLDLPGVGVAEGAGGIGVGEAFPADPGPLLGPEEVRRLRAITGSIRVAPALKGYIVDLIRATRAPHEYGLDLGPLIELGASPRATLALVRSSQGHALLSGRDYVTPFDVKSVARDVLRHRLLVSYEADAEGLSPDDVLGRILDHIRVP